MNNAMSNDKDPVQIVSVASTTECANQLNQNIFDSNDANTKHLNQFLNDSSAPNLFNTYKAHTEAAHTRTEDGGSTLERDAHTTNTLNQELTELEGTYENQTIGSGAQFAVSPFQQFLNMKYSGDGSAERAPFSTSYYNRPPGRKTKPKPVEKVYAQLPYLHLNEISKNVINQRMKRLRTQTDKSSLSPSPSSMNQNKTQFSNKQQ